MRDIDTLTRSLQRTENKLEIANRSLLAKNVQIKDLKAKVRDMEIIGRKYAKDVWYVHYLQVELFKLERAFDNLNDSVNDVIAKNKEQKQFIESIHVL